MTETADWSVLDDPEVVRVAGRAARAVTLAYGDRLTIEYDDAYQEALLRLATRPELVRECIADSTLGYGVLHRRLVLDLTDKVKTEARHRTRHLSYEALLAAAGPEAA
ncbi:hypothetical protein AB0G73_10505 [Streptomyces sp. NPDC020719]|uniref:hypothetical protein n=1 Tax=Streptomyces sp. NPDC020719 TaxID=3154896 RepID=UPI003410B77D